MLLYTVQQPVHLWVQAYSIGFVTSASLLVRTLFGGHATAGFEVLEQCPVDSLFRTIFPDNAHDAFHVERGAH